MLVLVIVLVLVIALVLVLAVTVIRRTMSTGAIRSVSDVNCY